MSRRWLTALRSFGTSILLGCGGDSTGPLPGPDVDPAPLAFGGVHVCRLYTVGDVVCWGRGIEGQLGRGTTPTRGAPAAVVTTARFTRVAAGAAHTCGLTLEGAAWCWGRNSQGQLGVGDVVHDACAFTACSTEPVRVAQGTLRFTTLMAGGATTCAQTADAQLYCWGSNATGQLGLAAAPDVCDRTPCSRTPVLVPTSIRFHAVTVAAHTCGLTSEGAAHCWGANDQGQLGAGDAGAFRPVPRAVVGGHRFRAIAAGGEHTCGITDARVALCWGGDVVPAGDGGVRRSLTPLVVRDAPPLDEISTGAWSACGRAFDGQGHCWGLGIWGELGAEPAGVPRDVPAPVAGNLRFRDLRMGPVGTCGVTRTDETWCWGHGDYGEVGPDLRSSATPVLILSQ